MKLPFIHYRPKDPTRMRTKTCPHCRREITYYVKVNDKLRCPHCGKQIETR